MRMTRLLGAFIFFNSNFMCLCSYFILFRNFGVYQDLVTSQPVWKIFI